MKKWQVHQAEEALRLYHPYKISHNKPGQRNAAAIDRLVHHSIILELNLTSYRLKQSKKGRNFVKNNKKVENRNREL